MTIFMRILLIFLRNLKEFWSFGIIFKGKSRNFRKFGNFREIFGIDQIFFLCFL
jgi:hypothetical protein